MPQTPNTTYWRVTQNGEQFSLEYSYDDKSWVLWSYYPNVDDAIADGQALYRAALALQDQPIVIGGGGVALPVIPVVVWKAP